MTDVLEAEDNPWSALLWGSGECAVSSYAAHDAIILLSQSWADDDGKNHRYALYSLEETIKVLSTYYWALKLVCDHEALNVQTADLVRDGLVFGSVSRADLAKLDAKLAEIEDLKKQVGLKDEQLRALAASALAPVAERGAA
jgi:hypothetical protein